MLAQAARWYVQLFGDRPVMLHEHGLDQPTESPRRRLRIGGWIDLTVVDEAGAKELRQFDLWCGRTPDGTHRPRVGPARGAPTLTLDRCRSAARRLDRPRPRHPARDASSTRTTSTRSAAGSTSASTLVRAGDRAPERRQRPRLWPVQLRRRLSRARLVARPRPRAMERHSPVDPPPEPVVARFVAPLPAGVAQRTARGSRERLARAHLLRRRDARAPEARPRRGFLPGRRARVPTSSRATAPKATSRFAPVSRGTRRTARRVPLPSDTR